MESLKELQLKKKSGESDDSIIVPKNTTPAEAELQAESKEPFIKCRYVATLIGFILFSFLNIYRISMSVAIVAMVNHSALLEVSEGKADSCPIPLENTENNNSSKIELISKQGEFDWSPKIQGYILSSYFLTYMVVQIPFGILVNRYGCKWFVLGGTLVAALATVFVPCAARIHPFLLIFLQILRGMGQGIYQPACAVYAVNWFPKHERGLSYTFIHSGAILGAFFGSIFAGYMCQSTLLGGWPSTFYILGFAGFILSVFVYFYLHESPSEHPRISKEELQYILNNQENALTKRRPVTPWSKVYLSLPVYALAIGAFGQFWALSHFLVVHSTYVGTILHFPMKENGFYSALPFLIMFMFVQVVSWISSFCTRRNLLTINHARKFWNLVACLGISACYVGLYLSGCNKPWNIALSCLALAFVGSGFSGVWIASADMSPTFSASINAVSITVAFLAGFVLPVSVGYLTDEMQTIQQWHKVFFLSIGVVMVSGVIFAIFGSADIQSWNEVKEESKESQDKNQDKTRY